MRLTRGDSGTYIDVKADRLSYGNKRQPVQNARANPSTPTEAYINDLGRRTEVVAIKGSVTNKTDYDALVAVANTWYTYGRITATYTWEGGSTTTWTGFVDSLNMDQVAGEVDIWDWAFGLVIGATRT